MTAEEKARDFMNYIARHHERLRRNLAKNITYDRDVFEDAFQDTVVRIHDAILRNDPEISDYEKYFFQASRKRYITLSNRSRQRMKRHIPEDQADLRKLIEEPGDPPATVEDIRSLVSCKFGSEQANLFIDYLQSKTRGRTNYRTFGMQTGIPGIRVKEVVSYIRQYLRKKYPGGLTADRAEEERQDTERIKLVIKRIREKYGHGIHRESEEGAKEG